MYIKIYATLLETVKSNSLGGGWEFRAELGYRWNKINGMIFLKSISKNLNLRVRF